MVFDKPRIEFIQIDTSNTLSTTGSGYTICERVSGENIDQNEWCGSYSPSYHIDQEEECQYHDDCDKTTTYKTDAEEP